MVSLSTALHALVDDNLTSPPLGGPKAGKQYRVRTGGSAMRSCSSPFQCVPSLSPLSPGLAVQMRARVLLGWHRSTPSSAAKTSAARRHRAWPGTPTYDARYSLR